jgi:two-component system nitrate/nitrite response regulator NarL
VIRLLIAIEIAFYREGLSKTLGRRTGISVVDAVGDAATALRRIERGDVDVALLEAGAEGTMVALRALRDGATKVIVLGVGDDGSDVLEWAESGAAGYVTRSSSISELARTIEAAFRGELRCSPHIAGALLRHVAVLAAEGTARGVARRLTRRELEVAELIERGLSNKEIADCLVIELATVKNHVHNILDKMGVDGRMDIPGRLRAPAHSSGTRTAKI